VNSVSISCQFDTSTPFDPTALIWGILGTVSVLGLAAWFYVRRRKAQDAAMGLVSGDDLYEDDEEEDEGGLEASNGTVAHGGVSGGDRNAPSRLVGATMATVPSSDGPESSDRERLIDPQAL